MYAAASMIFLVLDKALFAFICLKQTYLIFSVQEDYLAY